MGRQAIDVTGKTFGMLKVIGKSKTRNSAGKLMWDCKCECGNSRPYTSSHLRQGKVISCGCYDMKRKTKHGLSKTTEYNTWDGMLDRTLHVGHKDYSGRGIGVCPQWLDFETFLADMGKKPGPDYSLDRIDNDIGYFPNNCRWATRKEQHRNRRDNRMLTARGKTMCLPAWGEELGLNYETIRTRLDRGWSDERALSPVNSKIANT